MGDVNNPSSKEGEKSLSPQAHLPIIIKCEKPENSTKATNSSTQITASDPIFQTVVPLNIKREIEDKDSQLNTPQPHKPIVEVKKESTERATVVSSKNTVNIPSPVSTTANNATISTGNELDSITADCLDHLDHFIDDISTELRPENVSNSEKIFKSKPKKESYSEDEDEEQDPQNTIFTDDFFSELYTPIENRIGERYVDEATALIEERIQQTTVGNQSNVAQVAGNGPVAQVEVNTQILPVTTVDKPTNIESIANIERTDEDLIAQIRSIENELKMHKEKTHKHKKNKKKSKKRRRKSDSSDDDQNHHTKKMSYSTEINSPVIHIKEEPLFERRQRLQVASEETSNSSIIHTHTLPYMSSKVLKATYDTNYCEQKYELECLTVNPLFATKSNNLGFKPIKLEKLQLEPAKKPLTMQELKPQVKRLCAQINKVMKLPKDYKNTSDGLVAPRIMQKINLKEKDLINRSLLALNPITKYSFNNSSTHIDYRKIGLEVLQSATARLATLLGYDMRRLKERIMENQKRLGKNPIDLSDKSADAYSFLKDAATQTTATDKTGISIGVEAKPSAFNISTQTSGNNINDSYNNLPLMQFLPKLNDSEILAVTDFVELMLERKMGARNKSDSYQTRQRLFDIYNSAEVSAIQSPQSMNRNRDPRNQAIPPYIETAPNNSYISHTPQNYGYMQMSDQMTQAQLSPHYYQSPDQQQQSQMSPHYSQYGHNNPLPDRNFQNYYPRDSRMPR
ncbi:uncharacterized protein LOC119669636 [Teleopsis dalmanni]|uniref:uncharacterized protein LOC119669636 n=1 Tax=Teleopsis dalmanni TaxID=139649 RepID=UPI0018CD24BB|nr:uncharacterized protein LOC119669636 [Teleopsis dalmanni]